MTNPDRACCHQCDADASSRRLKPRDTVSRECSRHDLPALAVAPLAHRNTGVSGDATISSAWTRTRRVVVGLTFAGAIVLLGRHWRRDRSVLLLSGARAGERLIGASQTVGVDERGAFRGGRRTGTPRVALIVLCDHVAAAPAGSCSAGKARLPRDRARERLLARPRLTPRRRGLALGRRRGSASAAGRTAITIVGIPARVRSASRLRRAVAADELRDLARAEHRRQRAAIAAGDRPGRELLRRGLSHAGDKPTRADTHAHGDRRRGGTDARVG